MFGNGRVDDRRRRVLTEDVLSGGAKAGTNSATDDAGGKSRGDAKTASRYDTTATIECQPQITDLTPRGYVAPILVLFAGACFIAGLEALYFHLPMLAKFVATGRIAAFDLAGEGSLAAWFSTTTLTLAAAVSLVIYSVRKHRADDYHGRYRIWVVAACAWLWLGMDEGASLHEGLQELLVGLTGNRGFAGGAVWWIGIYGTLLTVIAVQLLLEMRECRTSTTFVVLGGLCYVGAVLTLVNRHTQWLPQFTVQPLSVMIKEGGELAGNLLLLVATLLHARYVVLEASGEITARPVKPRKEKVKATKSVTAKTEAAKSAAKGEEGKPKAGLMDWIRRAKVDPPHATPSAPARKSSDLEAAAKSDRVPSSVFQSTDGANSASKYNKVNANFQDDGDDDDDDDGSGREGRKLSKAERKAMRRQKESQRRGYGD